MRPSSRSRRRARRRSVKVDLAVAHQVDQLGQEAAYRGETARAAIHASVRALQHTRSSTSSIARRLILRQWRTLMMFLAVAYAHAAGAANDYGSLLKVAQDWRGFEQPVMSNCTPPHSPRSLKEGLDRVESSVFHGHDHDRCRQYGWQSSVLEAIGKVFSG